MAFLIFICTNGDTFFPRVSFLAFSFLYNFFSSFFCSLRLFDVLSAIAFSLQFAPDCFSPFIFSYMMSNEWIANNFAKWTLCVYRAFLIARRHSSFGCVSLKVVFCFKCDVIRTVFCVRNVSSFFFFFFSYFSWVSFDVAFPLLALIVRRSKINGFNDARSNSSLSMNTEKHSLLLRPDVSHVRLCLFKVLSVIHTMVIVIWCHFW